MANLTIYDTIQTERGTIFVFNHGGQYTMQVLRRCLMNDGYCPCGPEHDEDHLCPCSDLRKNDECHCGLYVKKEQTWLCMGKQ